MTHTAELTDGSVTGHLLRLAAPLIMGNILQQLYNTIDAFVLGRFAGAVTVNLALDVWFVAGLGLGIGWALVNRFWTVIKLNMKKTSR